MLCGVALAVVGHHGDGVGAVGAALGGVVVEVAFDGAGGGVERQAAGQAGGCVFDGGLGVFRLEVLDDRERRERLTVVARDVGDRPRHERRSGCIGWRSGDFADRVLDQVARCIDAVVEAFGAAVGGNQGGEHGHVDALGVFADADRLRDLEMQVVGGFAAAVHEVGNAPEDIALLDHATVFHLDRVRVHVEVVVFGAVAAFEADGGV